MALTMQVHLYDTIHEKALTKYGNLRYNRFFQVIALKRKGQTHFILDEKEKKVPENEPLLSRQTEDLKVKT